MAVESRGLRLIVGHHVILRVARLLSEIALTASIGHWREGVVARRTTITVRNHGIGRSSVWALTHIAYMTMLMLLIGALRVAVVTTAAWEIGIVTGMADMTLRPAMGGRRCAGTVATAVAIGRVVFL